MGGTTASFMTLIQRGINAMRPKAVMFGAAILPAKRLRFGGAHFQDDRRFLASGEEEVGRLQRDCYLTTESAILEIGCGTGRLPIGIISHLGGIRRYEGVDVHAPSIAWCKKYIGRAHTNFRFTLIDVHNARYNPDGRKQQGETELPFGAQTFDIIYLYSVFSHLPPDDLRSYLKEFRRLLVPGGHLFLTAFAENGVPEFEENPPEYRRKWKGALHCARYNRALFDETLRKHGFHIVSFEYGRETDGQSGYVLTGGDVSTIPPSVPDPPRA